MKALGSRVAKVWCQFAHPAPMWPVKGYYQCPVCLRSYPVPWEHKPCSSRAAVQDATRANPVGRSATAIAAIALK